MIRYVHTKFRQILGGSLAKFCTSHEGIQLLEVYIFLAIDL